MNVFNNFLIHINQLQEKYVQCSAQRCTKLKCFIASLAEQGNSNSRNLSRNFLTAKWDDTLSNLKDLLKTMWFLEQFKISLLF